MKKAPRREPRGFRMRRQADRIRLSDAGSAKIAALRERTMDGAVQNRLQNLCKIEVIHASKPRRKRAGKSGP